jgi:diadenosine tetraphosphate (Ap4A) HIT family hydrolase
VERPDRSDCYICRKHAGLEPAPPGGWLFQGRHFWICGSLGMSTEGTVLVEARRHFLDQGEMRAVEAAELASALKAVFPAIKRATAAERVYSVALMEGVPHFHLWLVPGPKRGRVRGLRYLTLRHRPLSRTRAASTVRRIRRLLGDTLGSSGVSIGKE